MIDDRILRALRHQDTQVRKKAILALAKSLRLDALPILAQVVENDPDRIVREMARKAALYIEQNAEPEPSFLTTVEEDEFDTPTTLLPDAPTEMVIPRSNKRRARSLIDQAVIASQKGRHDKALELARDALKFNPQLGTDTYGRNLLAEITRLPADEAVRALTDHEVRVKPKRNSIAYRVPTLLIMLAGVILIGGFWQTWINLRPFALTNAQITEDDGMFAHLSGAELATDYAGTALFFSSFETVVERRTSGQMIIQTKRSLESFSPYLVPAVGIVQFLLGVFLLSGDGPSYWYWLQAAISGVMAAIPLVWLYMTLEDTIVLLNSLRAADNVVAIETVEMLQVGFFAIGAAALLLLFGALTGLVTGFSR